MNLHRLACRFGQHLWFEDDYTTGEQCFVCQEPHPKNNFGMCAKYGHQWGEWAAIEPVAPSFDETIRDEIATYMMREFDRRFLGAHWVEDEPATERRACARCRATESNVKGHYEGEMPNFTGLIGALEYAPHGAVWTEDRLTEKPPP